MNEKIEKKPVFLSPFKRFCMTIGELPTSYLETMTYYEMLLWFTKYLGETVIPTINNNAEAVDEMQKLFVELQDYVNTYFENLDIQTEINNKLDEMAESGQLADIIAQYLQVASVLGYDTKNDLKNANNIVDGSICKTLGNLSYNDGNGHFYKIRTITSEDVVDDDNIIGLNNYPTLIAQKIKSSEKDMQKEVYIQNLFALPYRYDGETRIMQGGCYCGNNEIAVYFETTNTIQVINTESGNILRQYSNSIFGHGNSITKIDNYLYLVGTGDSNNNCYKIPYNTLDSYEVINVYGENKIPTGENISSIAYSPLNEKVYILTYPQFPNITIYEFNKDFSTLINTHIIQNEIEYSGFTTDMCCLNNYILINYNYGKLQIIDQRTMEITNNLKINRNSGNRYYSEIEWIDNINGKLIIGSLAFVGNGYGIGNNIFGTIDLYNSYRSYPVIIGKANTEGKWPNHNIIYVNTTLSNVKRDGSFNAPFNNIYEAINGCLIDDFEFTDIYLTGDFTNQQMYISNISQNIRIYNNDTNALLRFKNINISHTNNILLRNCVPTDNGILTLKECNIFLNYTKTDNISININGYNTSKLTLQAGQNAITFKGYSDGIIENVTENLEKGLIGIVDNINNINLDFMNCRNIRNMIQRCRLDGTLHNNTNSLVFYTSISSPKHLWVQVGANYYNIPITGIVKNYTIPVTNDTLSINISYDTTSYSFTTFKYTLTTTSTNIFDAYIYY